MKGNEEKETRTSSANRNILWFNDRTKGQSKLYDDCYDQGDSWKLVNWHPKLVLLLYENNRDTGCCVDQRMSAGKKGECRLAEKEENDDEESTELVGLNESDN